MKNRNLKLNEVSDLAEESSVQVKGLNLHALERLKGAVLGAGGPKVVAEKAGVAISTLNAATSGRNEPKIGLIAHLAAVIGTSLDWIVYGDPKPTTVSSLQGAVPSHARPDVTAIPYYNVRASAGPGSMPLDERPLAMLDFDRRVMRMLDVSPANAAFLTVHGDSGEPNLSQGDGILIDRSMSHLRDGGLFVIGIDGDVMVKRVARQADRSVLLMSDNPTYAPQHVSADDAERLRVIGRVRWAVRAL